MTSSLMNSNLVLIIFAVYRFSVQTLLNARKSLSSHAKNSVTLQLYIWHENTDAKMEEMCKFCAQKSKRFLRILQKQHYKKPR